jgi:hypothetical protein
MAWYQFEFVCKGVQTKFGDQLATNDVCFIINVGETKLHRILGDALKVHMRNPGNREIAWKNNGKALTVMVDDKGLTVVDPTERARLVKEIERQKYTDEMVDVNTSPERVEELRQLIREL